jgi:hypothetical protein
VHDLNPEVLRETLLGDEYPHHAFLAPRVVEELFTGDSDGTVQGAKLKLGSIKMRNAVAVQRRILCEWSGDMGRLL